MRLFLDPAAVARFARIRATIVRSERRTYYGVEPNDPVLALLVCRNDLELTDLTGKVADASLGWSDGQPGFVLDPAAEGERQTKITLYKVLPGPSENTLSEVLAGAPRRTWARTRPLSPQPVSAEPPPQPASKLERVAARPPTDVLLSLTAAGADAPEHVYVRGLRFQILRSADRRVETIIVMPEGARMPVFASLKPTSLIYEVGAREKIIEIFREESGRRLAAQLGCAATTIWAIRVALGIAVKQTGDSRTTEWRKQKRALSHSRAADLEEV